MTTIQQHHGIAGEAVLDLAEESSGADRLVGPLQSERAWTRGSVRPEQWTLEFTAAALAEIDAVVSSLRSAPLPLLLRHPDQFRLTACREVMAAVKQRLTEGLGLAVLSGLPIDELTEDEATAVYWVLGHFLAEPVATKWDGTMLYHVTDTGKRFGYGVRGSATNVELSFHTDNAFGARLPDYVGLLCHRTAASGGISRFCSLYTVHNSMLRSHPELLRRLYEPAYYDRQAEHHPDAPRVLWAPMFRQIEDGRLSARLVPGLIRRGYGLVDQAMDSRLAEALECLEGIVADPEYWVEFTIERGQMQYLNNLECGHYRSSFADSQDPDEKRHLIRVWHREAGARTYDG
jgi:alpha-ketoglutarate-dependent taurine dioxygenase